jgi:hypothetical protein
MERRRKQFAAAGRDGVQLCADPAGNVASDYRISPSGWTYADRPIGGRQANDPRRRRAGAWGCCNGIVNINPRNSLAVGNAFVAHLTLQSAQHSLIGITGGVFTAQDVRILGAVCDGISIYGPRAIVQNSYFFGNGYGSACPNSPPGAAIYVHIVPGDPIGGPVVKGSTFVHNGPPIDVDSVAGGMVSNNKFKGNDGWAAIALYRGANWTITHNVIQQPRAASRGNQPGGNFSYQGACQVGPAGAHPAGIWLCENSNANGLVADHNTISGNTIASYYGVLLMGACGKASCGPTYF